MHSISEQENSFPTVKKFQYAYDRSTSLYFMAMADRSAPRVRYDRNAGNRRSYR